MVHTTKRQRIRKLLARCSFAFVIVFKKKKRAPPVSNVKIEEIVKKLKPEERVKAAVRGTSFYVVVGRCHWMPRVTVTSWEPSGETSHRKRDWKWKRETEKKKERMKRQEKKKPRREVSDRAASFQFFLFFIFLFRPTMSRQWVKDAHASSSASSTRSSVTSFSSSSSSPFFHVRLPALILSGAVHCDPHRFFLRWFFFFHQDLRAFLLIVGFITRSGLVLHASRFSSRMEYLDLNRFMSSFCFYWKSSK